MLDVTGPTSSCGRLPRPRAVAVDLDGTLLRDDLSVSPRTRAALSAVEEAGILLVFVTGRPPRWIPPVSNQTDHRGLAICGNGAMLYDLATDEVVGADLIAADVLARVVELLRAHAPDVTFAAEYGTHFAHEPAFPFPPQHRTPAVRTLATEELVTHPAAKLMVRHEEWDSTRLLAEARQLLGELVEITHSTPRGPGLLEISAAGVSKASALSRFCAQRGIAAADVVAFGDMPNDLPMLGWAGRPYAMANAHPEVLAAVSCRAPSNEDDGVAAVLEGLLAA